VLVVSTGMVAELKPHADLNAATPSVI